MCIHLVNRNLLEWGNTVRTVESLYTISDGKVYGLNDMVRADCQDCKGCSDCCRGMGSSIILDPYDVFQIVKNEHTTFEELLVDRIELNVVDGIILPNLKMTGLQEQCSYLNEEGRCSIHAYRPSLCRLFPLGRCYEDHSYRYFLQSQECSKKNRSKVKVSKWIDTPDIKRNQEYIVNWHYFLKDVEEMLRRSADEALAKQVNMYLLNTFFIVSYNMQEDFYIQVNERMNKARAQFALDR